MNFQIHSLDFGKKKTTISINSSELEYNSSMAQLILIEPKEDLRDLLSLNLSTVLGINVIARQNAEDAINLLNILPSIDLILTRLEVGGEKTAFILDQFLKSEGHPIPLIILSDRMDAKLKDEYPIFLEPFKLENVMTQVANTLGFDEEQLKKKPGPDYIPVNAKYFLNLTEVPCDVYIRIKKSPTEFQFVKRIHVKDVFNREDIERYMGQGLKEFFVPKDYKVNFTKFVTNELIKKLSITSLTFDERLNANANAYDFVRDYISTFGLDDTAIELTEATIHSINQSVKANPQLSHFLESLKKNKIGYAYQHCHLMALLGHNILKNVEWGTPELFDKMCYVSFFHDISLVNEEHMKIGSAEELLKSNLTANDKQLVLEHAKRSAELVLSHSDAPFGADIIIMQHHGSMEGIGFSQDYSAPLSPLAMVIIVIEEFINEVFLNKKFLSLREVFAAMKMKFAGTKYVSIVDALEKSLPVKNG